MTSITVSIPFELTSCSHKKYNDPAASDLIYRTNAITVHLACNTLLPTVKNYLILTANVINHMN